MSRHQRRARARDERGAGLVEAAIVLPLLFGMIFGILEIGGALKSYSSASNAARAGGRMASVAGSDAMADQAIIERVAQEAAGLPSGELEYVIIWNAISGEDGPPAACVSLAEAQSGPSESSVGVSDGGTSQKGACNIYVRPNATRGAFRMARGELSDPPEYFFGCTGLDDLEQSHKVDCNWSPTHRKVQISPRDTPPAQRRTPDYVGVHIRANHRYYTGILGSELVITENSINLLEPDTYGLESG